MNVSDSGDPVTLLMFSAKVKEQDSVLMVKLKESVISGLLASVTIISIVLLYEGALKRYNIIECVRLLVDLVHPVTTKFPLI
jgi:hypothetical protein